MPPIQTDSNKQPSIVIGLSLPMVWLVLVDVSPHVVDDVQQFGIRWTPLLGWAVISLAVVSLVWANLFRQARLQKRGWVTGLLTVMVFIYTWSKRDSPFVVLFAFSALAIYLSALWGWLNPWRRRDRHPTPAPNLIAIVWGYVFLWVFCLIGNHHHWPARIALTGAGTTMILAFWQARFPRQRILLVWIQLGFLLPLILSLRATVAAVPSMIAALWLSRYIAGTRDPGNSENWFDIIFTDPAKALVTTFMFGAFVGGVILSLPYSTEGATALEFIDGLFTSTSAICVTGLAVVDTPTTFSFFGECTIVILIQLGGLGIMTYSTAALFMLGRRLSMRFELTASSLIKSPTNLDLRGMLKRVFLVTFLTEAAGAVVLSLLFHLRGEPLAEAIWRGVFTSISAFCNAGFSLQTDSLIGYQTDWTILLTVSVLIILGGLGPFVIIGLVNRPFGGRLSMQTRLLVVAAAVLVVLGMLAFSSFEWRNSLSHLSKMDRIVNSLFQSVTLRTAGFNSVDLTQITPSTYALMLPFMFVGGSPGSTAGGVKTTTLIVLILLVRAAFQGRQEVTVMGFRIRPTTVLRAAAAVVVAVLTLGFVLISILLTQNMSMDMALFEAVSALGTVGLSIGGTSLLDETGKVIIMGAMLIGRVGPLTLLLVLPSQSRGGRLPDMPEADLEIG